LTFRKAHAQRQNILRQDFVSWLLFPSMPSTFVPGRAE
jgi:hypothetical protein